VAGNARLTAPSIDGAAASSRSDCVLRVATMSFFWGSARRDEADFVLFLLAVFAFDAVLLAAFFAAA
jgi:hypothetical protein